MRIILLGGSGAGKGTQAKLHQRTLSHSPHLDRRYVTRRGEREYAIGRQGKKIMDTGGLVSDDIMLDLVKERIAQSDCANGFLLNGFPRTFAQAKGLPMSLEKQVVKIDYVVEIAL